MLPEPRQGNFGIAASAANLLSLQSLYQQVSRIITPRGAREEYSRRVQVGGGMFQERDALLETPQTARLFSSSLQPLVGRATGQAQQRAMDTGKKSDLAQFAQDRAQRINAMLLASIVIARHDFGAAFPVGAPQHEGACQAGGWHTVPGHGCRFVPQRVAGSVQALAHVLHLGAGR